MTSLIDSLIGRRATKVSALTFDEYASMFQLGSFPMHLNTTMQGDREEVDPTFEGLVHGAYRANGIVFACMLARFLLFSEARFQFQQMRSGRPGDLFGTPALSLLEQPEPGRTTGDLLSRAIIEADLAGSHFIVRRPNRLKSLRADWTSIIIGSSSPPRADIGPQDVDAEVVGYAYVPGGPMSGNDPQFFLAEEVAHFAPIPDPLARYRGMSWVLPVLREVMGHSAASAHKLKFFENAATPNIIVTLDPAVTVEKAREWIDLFEQEHQGVMNAYRTAYLGGGASGEVVGKDFQQMDFRNVNSATEVAIAAAAGIHPAIVGLSEALAGSSLNEGNFLAAKRLTADKTMRPLWRNLAGSLQILFPPPAASRLWYDDRDIPFLAEDRKDAATVLQRHGLTIRQLVDAGFAADTVVSAVTSGDLRLLSHTGLFSVQLQKAGDEGLRATETFWATSGPGAGTRIEQGMHVPNDHPMVALFPQFFEPVTALGLPGPSTIVSRERVIATREQLRLEGQPYGDEAVARALSVSPSTVKRRRQEVLTPT